MHMKFTLAAALAATISTSSAQACAPGTSKQEGGNWYCSAVQQITYTSVGGTGFYNEITEMSNSGTCSSKKHEYKGSLAPFNEPLSVNLRGPINLLKFAHYSIGTKTKRDAKPSFHARRHGHGHMHRRAVGDMVVAEIDGKKVSWKNEYGGSNPGPTSAPAAPGSDAPAPKSGSDSQPKGNSPVKAPKINLVAGQWSRTAFYDASSNTGSGLVFLNNKGGQGSGVFDMVYGNSLSYASSSGVSGSATPTVLKEGKIDDGMEIILMTNQECSDGSCGYVRPGTVGYHGFSGDSKFFVFELSMPDSGASGWNLNMPAVWLLNAQITNTLQYGKQDCSCWKSGCGEFDIIEVLDSGNTKCKSTFHGNRSGGSSHYFERAVNGPKIYAVLLDAESDTATIKVLDKFDFSATYSSEDISKLCTESSDSSVFNIS